MSFTQPNPAPGPALQLELEALSAFLDDAFPASARSAFGNLVTVEPGHVRMRLEPTPDMIRPGNIVSGPTLMGLVDVAAYAVVVAHAGPVAMALTTSLNVSFLRACHLSPVIADATLLKLGRTSAVIDVRLWQASETQPVAQATVSYALP